MVNPIDHIAIARGRLRQQYKESNLLAAFSPYGFECQDLEQAFVDVINSRIIDEAQGVQLDIIGEIVGQPRGLINAGAIAYFGFTPFPTAKPFGTLSDPSKGGQLRSRNEQSTSIRILTDAEYKIFIRAKIKSNITSCTPDELAEIVNFIFGTTFTYIEENPNDEMATYRVFISKALSEAELLLLQTGIIPSPAGVLVQYFGNNILNPDNPLIYSAQYTLAKELDLVYDDGDLIEFFYDSSLSNNTGQQPDTQKQPTFLAQAFPEFKDPSEYPSRPLSEAVVNKLNAEVLNNGYSVQLNFQGNPPASDAWINEEPWINPEEWPFY